MRVPTTTVAGVNHPGLMQDHDGKASCNEAWVMDPCPEILVQQMTFEGVAGTVGGGGLAQCLMKAGLKRESEWDVDGGEVSAYYRAARIYNSGSLDVSGDLGVTDATRCYASDVANRLTGWALAPRLCWLDDGRWKRRVWGRGESDGIEGGEDGNDSVSEEDESSDVVESESDE